jgi:hypothetical protein
VQNANKNFNKNSTANNFKLTPTLQSFEKYNSQQNVQPMLLKKRRHVTFSESDSEFICNEPNLRKQKVCSFVAFENNLNFFKNLNLILNKLFLDKSLPTPVLKISENELRILRAIFNKKKMKICFESENIISDKFLSKIMLDFPNKKRENFLKFTLPKCLKYVKSEFKQAMQTHQIDSLINPNLNDEYNFFNYYFGDISKREGIPLESFFMFRNWTHRFNKNIPKTVTNYSLLLWKKNPYFVKKILRYLENSFIDDLKHLNTSKINYLIKKWRKIAERNRLENAVTLIVNELNKRGSKVPWMITEARKGVDITLNALN